MNKEIVNMLEQQLQETDDSCPRCGNPLITIVENNFTLKKCTTQSFDVKTKSVIPCGYTKNL